MGKDYYKILDISRNATIDDIKKAYKKLALKYHPDRNSDSDKETAKAKFVEINEAYEILSDEKKKKIYDQFGEEGLKAGISASDSPDRPAPAPFSSFRASDPFSVFEQFFSKSSGDGDIHFSFLGRNPFHKTGRRRNHNEAFMREEDETVSEEDERGSSRYLYSPIFKRKPYSQNTFTDKKYPASRPKTVERPISCTLEEIYRGHTKRLKITRNIFNTYGDATKETKFIDIQIPPGTPAGTEFIVPECGDIYSNSSAGDIVFILEEKPHDYFTRMGDDIIYTATINLSQALTGVKLTIPLLDGKTTSQIEIRDMVIKPGYEKKIVGKGMPIKSSERFGDLIIKFNIQWPDSIDPADRKELKRILGKAHIR